MDADIKKIILESGIIDTINKTLKKLYTKGGILSGKSQKKRVIQYQAGFTLRFNQTPDGFADHHKFLYGIEEELDDNESYDDAFLRIRNQIRKMCIEDKEDLK